MAFRNSRFDNRILNDNQVKRNNKRDIVIYGNISQTVDKEVEHRLKNGKI